MNASSYVLVIALFGTRLAALGPASLSSPASASGVAPAVAASSAPSSPASAAPAPDASPSATVDTKNFAYLPAEVSVSVGSTIRFTNSDSIAHTVAAEDGSFDSSDMPQGSSWSHVFAKAGTYAYYCAYHRYMKGKIVVR